MNPSIHKNLPLALLTFFLMVSDAFGGQSLLFRNLSEGKNGLASNSVTSVCEDNDGFIWIGTGSGLNRYDGTSIKTFLAEDMKTESSSVTCAARDIRGNIWIGTKDGLSIYIKDKGEFHVPTLEDGERLPSFVSCFCVNPRNGELWLGTGEGMIYSCRGDEFILRPHDIGYGKKIKGIAFSKSSGILILGNYGELYVFDSTHGTRIPLDFKNSTIPNKDLDIVSISAEPENPDLIYAVSKNTGLLAFDLASKELRVLASLPDQCTPSDLSVSGNTIYVSTKDGLVQHNILLGKTTIFRNDPLDIFSLSENNLSTVFCASNGKIWTGGYYSGISFTDSQNSRFNYWNIADDGTSLTGAVVISISEDSSGRIWFGTESGGLFCLEPGAGTMKHLEIPSTPSVRNLFCHKSGIWISAENGIYRCNPNTFKISKVELGAKVGFVCFFQSNEGQLYLTTRNNIFKYQSETNSLEPIVDTKLNTTHKAFVDKDGKCWLVTFSDGIYVFDPSKDEHVWTKADIELNDYYDQGGLNLVESADSNIFVVSRDRTISRFDLFPNDENSNKSLSGIELNSVFSNFVFDKAGRIWKSYSNGLVCLDPDKQTAELFSEPKILLQSKSSYFRASNGDIYFGARDGLVSFSPSEVLEPKQDAHVIITDITVDGQPQSKNPDKENRIVLPSNTHTIEIFLACPKAGNLDRISYRVEGYSKCPMPVPMDGKLSFSNISPGSYTLHFFTAGAGEEQVSCHQSLEIVIHPPFFKSTAGIILIILAFCLIIAGIAAYLKYSTGKKAKSNLLKEKMSFISGVIHEIKTPLTLVSSPLKDILGSKENFSPEIKEDLNTINDASEYIQNLISELMSYLKSEDVGYNLTKGSIDLSLIIRHAVKAVRSIASKKKINILDFDLSEPIMVEADERALLKILNNLLQNALKYAEKTITLRIERKGRSVLVCIGNDGPIIPGAIRDRIFEPFFQYGTPANDPCGNFGIGLAFSRKLARLHGGDLTLSNSSKTEFILSLPIGNPATAASFNEDDEGFPRPSGLSLHILVVENDDKLARFTCRKLSAKYSASFVETAEEALDVLHSSPVDILITDIGMSGMSGLELCKAVTSDETISHIPIIVISAMFEESVKIECLKAGACFYIEKPFTTDYLEACIAGLLSRKENIRQQFVGGFAVSKDALKIPDKDAEFLDKLEKCINANIGDENFSVRTLCEELFISQSTLTRKMYGLLGMTPLDFIKERRLILASQMLSKGNVSVSDVCFKVGFNSMSYFAKCFKARFGQLPSEYLKSL